MLLSDVEPREVAWLAPHILRGVPTLLLGSPGTGKSTLCRGLASAVSAGGSFAEQTVQQGRVLLLTAEDDLAAIVRPDLDAFGGDGTQIRALTALLTDDGEMPLVLDGLGIAALEREIAAFHPALVIIDTITAYIGGSVDMHRANHVRAWMRPLAALAEKYAIALVLVGHLNKGTGTDPLQRGLGSIDFIAAARYGVLVAEHPTDPTQRVIAAFKSNLGPTAPPQGFAYTPGSPIVWTGEQQQDVGRLLEPPIAASKIDEAIDFLRERLQRGRQLADETYAAAREQEISGPTLKRARAKLKVEATQAHTAGAHGGGAWWWSLPDQADHAPSN